MARILTPAGTDHRGVAGGRLRGRLLAARLPAGMSGGERNFIRRIAPALPFIVLAAAVLVAVYHVLVYW